jgi:hypothetical protein
MLFDESHCVSQAVFILYLCSKLSGALPYPSIGNRLPQSLGKAVSSELALRNRRWPNSQFRHSFSPKRLIRNKRANNRRLACSQSCGGRTRPAVVDYGRDPRQ